MPGDIVTSGAGHDRDGTAVRLGSVEARWYSAYVCLPDDLELAVAPCSGGCREDQ
jgi:hypothetical protein